MRIEGGSDTTSGALLTFVLAACCYPDAVRQAQEELDRVIGHDRSPVLEDIGSLPYCDAFVKEVMRWRPVAPAGVPHLSTKDEIYKGVLWSPQLLLAHNSCRLRDPKGCALPAPT